MAGLLTYSRRCRPDEAAAERVRGELASWADTLKLGSSMQRRFGELSQGQQKLVIIARALIGAPPLVIMDEACQVRIWP